MEPISNKCPGCGSELSFDADKQALTCSHCDREVEIINDVPCHEKKPLNDDTIPEKVKGTTKQYLCSSCGRRHTYTKAGEMSKCPSCGSSDIRKTINLIYEPDAVIPIRISQQNAEAVFVSWIKKRKLAPNDFKKQAKMHNLVSRYCPTWDFATNVVTKYSGTGVNSHYDQENKRTYYTRHHFSGTETNTYTDFLQFATTYSYRALEDSLGYFGTDTPTSFKYEYLYGYDVKDIKLDLQESWKYAKSDIQEQENRNIKAKHNYDSYDNYTSTSYFREQKYSLLYVPVYELNYEYKTKLYTCYVNGYTGEVSGKSPKSALKITAIVLFILAIIGTILYFSGAFS